MKLKKTRLRVLFVISSLFAIIFSFVNFREQLHQGYLKWNQSADIVMFGDSHTVYGKWNVMIHQYSVVKYAWGGYTSEMLVDKISRSIPFKPKYVFILCGGNDIYDDSFSVENTLHNFKLMADTLRDNNVTPVFQKLMYKHDDPEFNTTIDSINRALTNYCLKEQIDMIDIGGKDMYDSTGLKASLTTDNLHLNEKGYTIWSKAINSYLENH
ncbi:MAG: lysophospholipase L1-like esterase [Dokdonia sp.]|jgi:lysophospholipase L1-like esterase